MNDMPATTNGSAPSFLSPAVASVFDGIDEGPHFAGRRQIHGTPPCNCNVLPHSLLADKRGRLMISIEAARQVRSSGRGHVADRKLGDLAARGPRNVGDREDPRQA
jgi:hypothetical protein